MTTFAYLESVGLQRSPEILLVSADGDFVNFELVSPAEYGAVGMFFGFAVSGVSQWVFYWAKES
jgi:hypothetical protein